MGKQKIRCLIDTGSTTSVVKRNILTENYPEQKLETPIKYRTINGFNEICFHVVTPFPKEFQCKGTLSWKIVDFRNDRYDAIMGQNFLIPLKAVIDDEHGYVNILGNKFFFEKINYPLHTVNICALEPTSRKHVLDRLDFSHLNEDEKNKIMCLLRDFTDLFYVEGDNLSATTEIEHQIITNSDRPLYSKIYRYPQVHESEIQRQIKDMLRQNIIRESNSPYNSPLWVVPKKQDNSGIKKWRIVIDYRKLNENTVDDKFPIPNLNGILDKLGKSQYFTTLDLAKGFHQILVKEEDRKKTAFSTHFGHYEFIRMPFGLKNAPSTFQRLMNSILREQINKTCVVYMDDILVFSTSLEEHKNSLKSILEAIRKAKLKIQIDKCDFLKKETQFLGHLLTNKGIKPNPEKIKIIQNLQLPQTTKQIKSFLGMTGFYRKFIKDYAKIATPLTKALRKNEKINRFDPNYILAFEKLKEIVTNAPILRYPIFSKKFKITTDASNFAIGAVLSQEGHPIAYASRTLNVNETNYSTIEKELLAIVWGVKYFRPYIYGREFDLECDHEPLKWLQVKYTGKDINPRLQRWLVQLGEYNMKINYIKGELNKVADFLSRINSDTNEINYLTENDSDDTNDNRDQDSLMVHTDHSLDENSIESLREFNEKVSRIQSEIFYKTEDVTYIKIRMYNKFESIVGIELVNETSNFCEMLLRLQKRANNNGIYIITWEKNDPFFSICSVQDFKNHCNKVLTTLKILLDDQSEDGETIHSQEEYLGDSVPILDTVVNRFKTQIIILDVKEVVTETIFGKKRIYIDRNDITNENISNILRREVPKGKIGIFSKLNDHEYYKVQLKLIEEFPDKKNYKFVKCSKFAKDIVEENDLKKQIALFHKFETGHAGIIPTYEKIKHKIYNPNLKEFVQKVINNCETCSGAKYDRNPIKTKFKITETPSTTNEIIHVDTYVNSKHSFIIFIDKFSKHVISFHLPDRNSRTLLGKIRAFLAIKGRINKFVLDNEFNNSNIRNYLEQEGIQYHFTKPNSHTGNSDIERFNNTVTEKIRVFNLEEKLPINSQILNAIKFYNSNYHSTIKCSPLDVQNKLIDHSIIKERLKDAKFKIVQKRNKYRENYVENRKVGFIKNYKSLRHKEQPKFIKKPLENVHESNIKRPFKFADPDSNGNDDSSN